VKQGVYEEYVTITRAMENVTMYGDGAMKTVITGSRNFADGLTTYKTATFSKTKAIKHPFRTRGLQSLTDAVVAADAQGDGFIAIALGFRNTAGAAKHQAVALLVQSDRSIFLNCRMDAFQDTLYAHSKAQFYRNCVISGTIDFVFGDAAAVFQNCVLLLRRPMDNQQNIATAQGRADGRESTGFVFQYCRFTAEAALRDASRPPIRSYLARPWREYSRTLIMECDIPAFIDKAGYLPWNGDFGLKTLWYAEYANRGPGADTAGRVAWPGYKKVISKEEADKFTVQNFLHAEPWLKPTGTPVKYGFWA
jgi:pectin methylesterase-like acyl-CoA thioesterase